LTHVEPADEMGRNSDIVEVLEDVFGDPVIENAFALNDLVLLGVEGGGVVLEMLDQRSRLGAFIENLRLAFINAAAATHRGVPWVLKVHRMPWLLFVASRDPRRRDRTFAIALKPSGHKVKLADQSKQHNRGRRTFSTPHYQVINTAACCLDAGGAICKAASVACVRMRATWRRLSTSAKKTSRKNSRTTRSFGSKPAPGATSCSACGRPRRWGLPARGPTPTPRRS